MTINPVPGHDSASVDRAGRSSGSDFRWKQSINRWIKSFDPTRVAKLIVGSPTGDDKGDGAINAEEIYESNRRVFSQGGEANEGLDHNWVDHGTLSSGTLTVDPLDGFFHKVTLTGGVAISPASSRIGSCILHITNGASANGSFSGWIKKDPSVSLTTTNGHKFRIVMMFLDSEGADYAIFARQ